MSANIEYALITRAIKDADFHTMEKLGVSSDFFTVPEMRNIFDFLKQTYHHPNTQGQIPSEAMVQHYFPSFAPAYAPDPVSVLCESLRREKLTMDLGQLVETINIKRSGDPYAALTELKIATQHLASVAEVGQDMSMSGVVQQLFDRYNLVASMQGVVGIPYPWEALNLETQGMQAQQFIVLYGRPKSMKCVCEGQRIMLADGSYTAIEKVPERTFVPSYTGKTGRIRTASAHRVVSGEKECVEVETESGLRLRTSNEHLYMVPGGGYSRIRDLRPGDYVATARRLPNWEVSPDGLSPDIAYFIGVLVGDGNYTRNEVQFTTADRELLDAVILQTDAFGCTLNETSDKITYRIVGRDGKNPVLDLLRSLGIHGQGSRQKRVPEKLFNSSKPAIAAFLAGMFDTDGHAGEKFSFWSSTSRSLLEDMQHLLMRFGIRGRVKEVVTNFDTVAYSLFVYSKELNQALFEAMGPYLHLRRKKAALGRLAVSDKKEKRNTDAIPYTKALHDEILIAKGSRDWPSWGASKFDASKLFRRTNRISRKMLLWLAAAFESEKLKEAASTDIIWEQIQAITPIGRVQCYDICITDGQDPNFVVEGFVVHNTWVAVWMAVHAYVNSRRRVLFYTREMSPFSIAQRAAAAICKMSYGNFKNGTLQPHELDLARSVLSGLLEDEKDAAKYGHQPYFIITADKSGTGGGVSWLRAKIRDLKPDIVFVDGMYLMKDDRSNSRSVDWKNITHISQDLKLTAQEFDIPVVGITQANRGAEQKKGEDLTELSYSDALGQDADAVFRTRRIVRCDESTANLKQTEVHLTAPGMREGVFDGIVLRAVPAIEFSYLRNLTTADFHDEPDYGSKQQQKKPLPNGASFQGKPQQFLKIDPKPKF